LAGGVDVGGVDEVDPGVEGPVDDGDAVVVVPVAELAEHHGAEAQARDLHPGVAEGAVGQVAHVNRSSRITTDRRWFLCGVNGEEHDEGVMPLVLCRSRGGPYDDEAFVSGWRLGDLAAKLAQPGISTVADSIRPHERVQADLIAMACGFLMTIEYGDEAWLSVTFTRIPEAA
jgi:hypothetical protein